MARLLLRRRPIRALALQNLRSLEDDPGSKVMFELRRRHFALLREHPAVEGAYLVATNEAA